MRFGHLEIEYDDRVLTPRPWTVRQSEWAAQLLPSLPDGPVLELCSGAGQIGLLATAATSRRLVCVDLDPAAAELTELNAGRAGRGDLVHVRTADLGAALQPDERFALVIADPPWVPSAEVDRYPEDPPLAIDGGAAGTDVAMACMEVAARHLQAGGAAILQLGTIDQAARVVRELPGSLRVQEVRDWPGEGVLVHLVQGSSSEEP